MTAYRASEPPGVAGRVPFSVPRLDAREARFGFERSRSLGPVRGMEKRVATVCCWMRQTAAVEGKLPNPSGRPGGITLTVHGG